MNNPHPFGIVFFAGLFLGSATTAIIYTTLHIMGMY